MVVLINSYQSLVTWYNRSMIDQKQTCIAALFLSAFSSQFLCTPAFSEELFRGDVLNVTASAGVNYDSNLFRLSSGVDSSNLPSKLHRSDMIYNSALGLKLDKPYSLQRFQVNATANQRHYSSNDFLNFNSVNYRAAWLWQLTPEVSGVFLAQSSQTPTSFSDFRNSNNLSKSTQTTELRNFSIDAKLFGGWHALGGVSQNRSKTDQQLTAVGDFIQNNAEFGAKYVYNSGTYISGVYRTSKGEYQGRTLDFVSLLDTRFRQNEGEARLFWPVTLKSTIDSTLAHINRKHDNFSQRDFSGATGRVTYTWLPTAQLQFQTQASRQLVSFQEFANSYYVADIFSIEPSWSVTAKTTLRGKLEQRNREYKGAVVPVSTNREDVSRTVSAGIDCKVTRTVLLNAIALRERRTSNISGLDYNVNTVSVSAQLSF